MMNPLAQKLNDEIKQSSPEVLDMMSQLGKEMFQQQLKQSLGFPGDSVVKNPPAMQEMWV